ncbi:hypothetical protein HDU98_010116 [Podochytrium sp. JEL0797]|nr:hypothetical protein HDU98_010116 [Podochytrium sp. JEL0797]
MFSYFGSTAPTHPFTLGELVGDITALGWQQHKATKRDAATGTNVDVSVFVFDSAKPGNKERMPLAKNALKRFKTLRHPGIVGFVDGAENENQVIIGTELVTPLSLALSKDPALADDQNFLALGLFKIASAIKFLNADVQMTHGNIRLSSIYITKSGEWKLGGLDAACNLKDVQPILVDWGSRMPDSYKYSPPECSNGVWTSILDNPIASLDSWGFGCLLYEIFNNTVLPSKEVLTNVAKIPKPLLPHYKHLLTSNPKSRHDVATVFERCKVAPGGYFVNEFITVCLALEQFSIKDAHEKDQFLTKLNLSLDTFPTDFCKYKILPELIKALEFGGAGAKALTPILKIGNKLDQPEFESLLVPILIKMFALPDRAIRVSLCENFGGFIEKVNARVLNEKIFPNLSTGFSDTNAVVRECSLRSVLVIAPKLSERIINNDLLRFLAKLQSDEEPGIRANTTICIGKLAPSLTETTRKKVLLPAFTRSLHDPFAPTRNAGLLALQATAEFYTPQEMATRVVPMLSSVLLDPERSIRQQAFKNVTAFVARIEKFSDAMVDVEVKETTGSPVTMGATGGGNAPVAGPAGSGQDGWAGWAVGALSSTIVRAATSASGAIVGEGSVRKSEDVARSGSGTSSGFGAGNSMQSPVAQSSTMMMGGSGGVGLASALPPVAKPSGGGGMALKPTIAQTTNVGDWNTGWEDKANNASSFGAQPLHSAFPSSATHGATSSRLAPAMGGMSLKPKAAVQANISDWSTEWEDKPKAPAKAHHVASPVKAAPAAASGGWDDPWDAQPASASPSAASLPPSMSANSSFGGIGEGSGGSVGDREAEKQRKREQLALLREQKKAAIAAKKMNL